MRRIFSTVWLGVSGLGWFLAGILVIPLAAAMRADHEARGLRVDEDGIGYDDDDPGIDVDECDHMLGTAPGSCNRCEGT